MAKTHRQLPRISRRLQGGHEHDHDCVVPHAVARLLSPRAALKELEEEVCPLPAR